MPGFMIPNVSDGTPNFRNTNTNLEYMYKYTWAIEYLFIGANIGNFRDNSPEIQLKDATLPVFTANKEVVTGGSLEYKFAKSVSFDDVKVVWYDTVGMLDIVRQWRALVWNPETGLAVARQYKRRSEIAHYTPHANANGVNRYVLINSWPSVIRHGELTYSESDVNIVEVTITYDWSQEP